MQSTPLERCFRKIIDHDLVSTKRPRREVVARATHRKQQEGLCEARDNYIICNKSLCGCDTWKGALSASTDRCRVVDTKSAMGLGLEAVAAIPKGLIIGWYSGRTVSCREEELVGCNRVRGRPSEYTMYIGNGYCVDGENNHSNVVKYANHECSVALKDAKRQDLPSFRRGPNCTFEMFHDPEASCPSRSTRVALVANVDIAAGSWCTVDYGDMFCVPKPCLCTGCIMRWLEK